jgi:MSHA biogenesis protein MshL
VWVPLAGCAGLPSILPSRTPLAQLREEVTAPPAAAATAAAASAAAATAGAAAPPPAAPSATAARPAEPPEPRFDVIVSSANAREFFLAMVTDTRYSMLMHPEVNGHISVSLKGVTVREALESVRDVYGYDFRIDGHRITVYPPTMQTRLFTVNYLNAKRVGRSEVRVSGSGAPSTAPGTAAASGTAAAPAGHGNTSAPPDSSHITTHSASDFWPETVAALRILVGDKDGRTVIASPQAGTIAVRAMPDELRQVDAFLRASRIAVERQVMLEAKIIEVELREGFASGIDWSYAGSRGTLGQTSGYAGNPLVNNPNGIPTLPQALSGLVDSLAVPAGNGGTMGLALATKGFQAVMGFLQSQGDLQVLSSPRVATLNNQKAVLKVGTDEYFLTNVAGGSSTPSSTGGNPTTTLPTLTLTPFFSGIALDVTPQIDEHDMITLHLRPSVTSVTERTRQIDLGTVGNYRLPLASSSVNETDTVVRVADGHIVAIGGLMLSETTRRASGLPGSAGNPITRALLGNQADAGRKRELVVLLRPTILRSAEDWQRSSRAAVAALEEAAPPVRTIRLEGGAGTGK